MRKLFLMGFCGFILFLTTRCGDDATSSSIGPTSLSDLPKATGPVVGSSSISKKMRKSLVNHAATTGIKLSALGDVSWSGKSRAACETSSIIREAFAQAAEPDTIQCYISKMAANGFDLGGDPYDGAEHYLTLAGIAGHGNNAVPKIKMVVTKASSGAIESFKMWMCFGGTTENPTQDGYVSQVLSDPANAVITAVYSGAEGSNTYASRTTATGAVNSSGQWTSKQIVVASTNSWGSGSYTGNFSGGATVTQYSDRIALAGWQSGAMSGSWGGQSFSNTFSARMSSIIQILNAGLLSTLALGDGSAKYILSGSGSQGGSDWSHSAQKIASWAGDDMTAKTASTGDYYTAINRETPPNTTSVSVSFNGAEAWNCQPASGTSFTALQRPSTLSEAAMEQAFAACETLGRNWINCHQNSGGGEGSDESY